MGHEANDGKDDKASKDGRAAVCQCNQNGVPVTVVVELVVAGQGDEAAEGRSQRVEDLRGCVRPHQDGPQRLPLWVDVEVNAFGCPRQSCTSDEQDHQHHVGEEGGEVDHLPRRLDSLDEAEADNDPSTKQADDQLPPEATVVCPSGVLFQAKHHA